MLCLKKVRIFYVFSANIGKMFCPLMFIRLWSDYFNSFSLVANFVACRIHWQIVWTQIKMYSLIYNQIVWDFDVISESLFFEKVNFLIIKYPQVPKQHARFNCIFTSLGHFWSAASWFERWLNINLFVCLLYVPSQQLWSLRDGQFT